MKKEIKFRHELKYLVRVAELAILRNKIQNLVPIDSRAGATGAYSICSLYFEDYENNCYCENENGTDHWEKIRIRIYNHSTDRISLECKRKERARR